MRAIFCIYWGWYVASIIANSFRISELWLVKIVGLSTFLSFSFICLAPLYYLIHERKGRQSDPVYMNACMNAAMIRVIIWCFAFYGLTDTYAMLAMNAFGMLVFILIERKLKRLDKNYFNF